MSVYQNSLKIKYLEASSHNTAKTEFRIPNNTYALPNLRLANVGVYGTVGTTSKIGVTSLIKNISILSDRTVIDSLRNANHYESFRQLTQSNAMNKNIYKYLNNCDIGYNIDKGQQVTPQVSQSATTVLLDETALGMVELPALLSILNEDTLILDTNKFKNLSVVIEWEQNQMNYLHDATNGAYTIAQPTLIYDELINPVEGKALSGKMQNFNFTSIEHDSINLPNGNATAPAQQAIKRLFKAFQDKYIGRMVLIKQFANLLINNDTGTNVIRGKGYYGSPVQWKENINFIVNSVPMFESDELSNDAVKSYITGQTYGALNSMPYENTSAVGSDDKNGTLQNFTGIPEDLNTIGMSSYLGVRVQKKIKNLELHYSRQTVTDTNAVLKRYNEELVLHLYCEVSKQLIFNNGQFIVSYL